MKPLVRRIFLLFASIVFATLLIGASRLAGRSIDAKFVLAEIRENEPLTVTYGILDLDRNIFARRVIDVPGYSSTGLGRFPPLVMQSVWGDDTIDWTLNSVDVWTGQLTPEVKIETDRRRYLYAMNFRQYADGHWTYQEPSDFNLYFTDGDALEAKSIEAAMASGTVLSNDGKRFAIEAMAAIFFTDMETGERTAAEHDVPSPAYIRWSPDDRYISLFSQGATDSTMQVIDTESLETAAEFKGRALRWCGERLIYVTNPREAVFEAWLHDLETGAEEIVVTRDLSELAITQRNLTVAGLKADSCDWLYVAEGNALSELMHRESGRTIPLGYSPFGAPFWFTDGAVMVTMASPQLTELRRIVLDPATESYEVLVSLKRLSTSITWIDDARGGLYLRGDDLVRIAPVTSAETVLPFGDIQSFVVMP
jgi:hypothetical protein